MDAITALAKRRGFVFGSSEIYGGLNGFFDYGPMGVELKRNIKETWWRDMVHRRDDMVGLDGSIISNPNVWKASGHVDGFTDPLVDCKESKMRYRADQLFFAAVRVDGQTIGYISLLDCADKEAVAQTQADALKRKLAIQGKLEPIVLKEYTEAQEEEIPLIPSPATGKPGSLTAARSFNLMFETYTGALKDASSTAYLRPETAQAIFINFKNVVDTTRVKLPFGIAQIGKAFRNEITPRNFIFRSREFEQMEIEYFIPAGDDVWPAHHEQWIETRLNWLISIGLPKESLVLEVHPKEKLAHYARACTDITFKFPFGTHELEGIAARGCFDLEQHQNASGKNLEYFDENSKSRFLPHVIEPSVGVDRIFLALLCAAYDEDEMDGEKRVVLRFHPKMAPIKAGIFPLVKNKPEIMEKAQSIFQRFRRRWNVAFDGSGAIGKRYRRMDEVGTPWCLTIDYQTLEDGTITLRNRDDGQQVRLTPDEAYRMMDEALDA
jgi:glycyl-tRNA synthetase